MAVTRGVRTTGGVLAAQIVDDFANEIWGVEFNNEEAVLCAILNNIKQTREVHASTFKVLEDIYRLRTFTVNGAVATTNTSITLDAGQVDFLQGTGGTAYSMLYVPSTGERLLVTSVTVAGDSITVSRNLGSAISANSISDGVEIFLIGDVSPEAATSGLSMTTQTVKSENYTSIFKTAVEFSGTEIETELYGEARDEDTQLKKKAKEHKMELEAMMWLSPALNTTDATTGYPLRCTGGILQTLGTGNVINLASGTYGGNLTMEVLDLGMEQWFENNPGGLKYAFGGMTAATALDRIVRQYIRVDDGKTSFGTNMREFKTNKGTIRFVMAHKIFRGELAGDLVVLDLDHGHVKYVNMKGRNTKLFRNIKTDDGYDGKKHAWQTECGLHFTGYGRENTTGLASTGADRSVHGRITGISGS